MSLMEDNFKFITKNRCIKILRYISFILFIPLFFTDGNTVKNIEFCRNFIDIMTQYFPAIEARAISAKDIYGYYYIIKFIYSYSILIVAINYIISFYLVMMLYLYNLGYIKKRKCIHEVTDIKKYGSNYSLINYIYSILVVIFFIWVFYFFSFVDIESSKFTFFIINKYGIIAFNSFFSSYLGIILSILSVDLIFKIYKRDFRFEHSKAEEAYIEEDKKSKLHKIFAYMIPVSLITLLIFFLLRLIFGLIVNLDIF